jgi:hypothetical protein
MIRAGDVDKEYIKDVVEESMKLIDGVWFTPGAARVGYMDGKDQSQIRAYQDDIRPDSGRRLFPERKNASKNEKGVLLIYDTTINNFLAARGEEAIKTFCREVMIPASRSYVLLMDQKVRARLGADGQKKEGANLIGMACTGILARSGELSAHTHIIVKNYVFAQDGKVRSGDMRPLMVRDDRVNRIVQNVIASRMEDVFGVKMMIEPKRSMARIVGVNTQRNDERRRAAIEHLEKEGVTSRSRIALAYAFQNTRPTKPNMATVDITEKAKGWQRQAEKIEPKKVEANERGLFARLVEDFVKLPVEVFASAWKARKGQGEHVRGQVMNVAQFIADTKPPSRADRHRAALKAVKNTQCKSFLHALTVAERGYKTAKPKLVLPKGARVAVNAQDIKSREQLRQLEKLAKKNEWRLRVRGELKEEQKRGLSL